MGLRMRVGFRDGLGNLNVDHLVSRIYGCGEKRNMFSVLYGFCVNGELFVVKIEE